MSDIIKKTPSQKIISSIGKIFGVIAITVGAGAVTCGGNLLGFNIVQYESFGMIFVWGIQILIAFIVSIFWCCNFPMFERFKKLQTSVKGGLLISFLILPTIIMFVLKLVQ